MLNDRNTLIIPTPNEHVFDEDTAGTSDVCLVEEVIGKRKKKSPPIILKDDDEKRIAKWIETQGHYIFDKGHREYKNAQKTALAFETLGKSLNPSISGPELRKWFHSNRSRLGRLTLGQSDPDRRLTQREKWIIEIFGFLTPHIVRHRKSKVVAFKNVSTFTQLN